MATKSPLPEHTKPDNPEMVIRALTPSVTIFSMPFARHGVLHFGLRCTAIRLRTGSLAIISACPLTPTVLTTLTQLAPDPTNPSSPNVRYLIAPDLEHHLHLGQWKEAFPSAHILAPEGLREKRASMGFPDADTPYAHVWKGGPEKRTEEGKYGSVIPQEFKDEIDVEYFEHHDNKDVALLHKPDGGTLIEADLWFNLPGYEQYSHTNPKVNPNSGVFTKAAMCFIRGPKVTPEGRVVPGSATGHRRFAWYVLGKHNRPAYADCVKVVSGWEFKRLVPCHGDVVEDGPVGGTAKAAWNEVYAWFFDLKKE